MSEPRKNYGRKRVPRNSKTPVESGIRNKLDLILRFDAGVLTTERRFAIVDKIMAAVESEMDARYGSESDKIAAIPEDQP